MENYEVSDKGRIRNAKIWQVDRAAIKGAITRRFLSEQTEIIKKLEKSWDFIWLSQLFFVPLHQKKKQ